MSGIGSRGHTSEKTKSDAQSLQSLTLILRAQPSSQTQARGSIESELKKVLKAWLKVKDKVTRKDSAGDCELVPLEKEAPLDDNCQRGCGTMSARAEICVLH